ncbi:MAG: hypothetical protein E6795_12340 [Enterococcus faecalis]|jgi:hypothetical protein|uniref:Uncharacterized protein n=1 Tax=Enterococcus faecalis TaxID=1351 RepID=A0AC59HN19_ENTFL|nr:hypothetical protein [Enterococcus faecalis]DAK69739.1 MAG TPA: Terminase large subunit [Caudoviricetes sp.]EKZ0040123.1 hypothetical protein [Enterococcus faecalis]EOJ96507.1 hypothetical protein WOK_02680 [Enterococcus faecalis EnGen0359]MDK6983802.1 hypothetical protein [Enterococcus faecalis]MDK7853310.1 hypothetical protein [Enterococcus faecalis]
MSPKKRKYLNLIKTNPVIFGNLVGFNDLGELHNDWLKSFLFEKDDQTLLAHRGSFKTTTLAIAIALLMVLFPNKNIIFLRKTDTDVVEIILQVAKVLSSKYFKTLVFALYGVELVLLKETTTEIDTNLKTSSRGTSQLLGMGIYASLTGKHADIVITDDIVNIKDRVSRAERERTKLQYQELQNVKNRGGRFINTGTPWHKEDAISKMPNVKKFDCYETGLIDKEQRQALQQAMTPSLFAANYELKHIADSESLFTAPTYTDSINLIYNGVAHIDAAYGGDDSTALTIFKEQKDGTIIGYGRKWQKHVDDCLPEILRLHQHYQAGTFHTETNGDKGYLAKNLRECGQFVTEYHESMNKFIKISTYLRKYWHLIIWLEDTDKEYIAEILDYTENAEHDDAPDSAASLLRTLSLKNPQSLEERMDAAKFFFG